MSRRNFESATILGVALSAILFAPALVRGGCLPATILDDDYVGILDGDDGVGADAGMLCCTETHFNQFPGTVADVNVSLALTHTWIGDLVAKVQSPSGTVSTIFSRPGLLESADDGGGGCCGSGTDWTGATVLFDEQTGGPSAESLGEDGEVCAGSGICEYTPDQGAGPGSGLDADFDGETYVGTWQVCIGDAQAGFEGAWDNYSLEIVLDRDSSCVCGGKFRGGDRVRYTGGAALLDESAQGVDAESLGEVMAPPIGTEGEVACGFEFFKGDRFLAAWEYSDGHDGNAACDCPTGDLGSDLTTSGWFVACNEAEFVLPFKDDFETGDFIRWSVVTGDN